MKQYQSKHTAVLSTRGFYTILSLCALIIAASAWVIWGNAHRQNSVEPDTGMPIIAPADSTAEAPAEPATVPQQEQEPESVLEEQPVAAAEPEPAVTVSAPVYVRPVSGAVLTPFSGDTLLFQPTMGDWRVHAGTDFSAEAGETVLALTDGTVQQIAEDGLYGTCVTLTHNNGLTSSYCGMDDVRVQEGQVVSAGEALGVCADSIPAESALGTHVHVQVTQNDARLMYSRCSMRMSRSKSTQTVRPLLLHKYLRNLSSFCAGIGEKIAVQ